MTKFTLSLPLLALISIFANAAVRTTSPDGALPEAARLSAKMVANGRFRRAKNRALRQPSRLCASADHSKTPTSPAPRTH